MICYAKNRVALVSPREEKMVDRREFEDEERESVSTKVGCPRYIDDGGTDGLIMQLFTILQKISRRLCSLHVR